MGFTRYTGATNTIQELSDTPNAVDGLTAAQIKAKHDQSAVDSKANHDNLADELESVTASEFIGHQSDNIIATNVKDALEENNALIENVAITVSSASAKNYLVNSNFERWDLGDEFTDAEYTANNWKLVVNGSGGKVYKVAPIDDAFENSLRIEATEDNDATAKITGVEQLYENYEQFRGKQVTLSCKVDIDYARTVDLVIQDGVNTWTTSVLGDILTIGGYVATLTSGVIDMNSTKLRVLIRFQRAYTSIGNGVNVQWAKLDLGTVNTTYIQPTTKDNLKDCQRYNYVVGNDLFSSLPFFTGIATSTSSVDFMIPTPEEMAGEIDMEIVNNFGVGYMGIKGNGVSQSLVLTPQNFTTTTLEKMGNYIRLTISLTADTPFTVNDIYFLCLGGHIKLRFDANL